MVLSTDVTVKKSPEITDIFAVTRCHINEFIIAFGGRTGKRLGVFIARFHAYNASEML